MKGNQGDEKSKGRSKKPKEPPETSDNVFFDDDLQNQTHKSDSQSEISRSRTPSSFNIEKHHKTVSYVPPTVSNIQRNDQQQSFQSESGDISNLFKPNPPNPEKEHSKTMNAGKPVDQRGVRQKSTIPNKSDNRKNPVYVSPDVRIRTTTNVASFKEVKPLDQKPNTPVRKIDAVQSQKNVTGVPSDLKINEQLSERGTKFFKRDSSQTPSKFSKKSQDKLFVEEGGQPTDEGQRETKEGRQTGPEFFANLTPGILQQPTNMVPHPERRQATPRKTLVNPFSEPSHELQILQTGPNNPQPSTKLDFFDVTAPNPVTSYDQKAQQKSPIVTAEVDRQVPINRQMNVEGENSDHQRDLVSQRDILEDYRRTDRLMIDNFRKKISSGSAKAELSSSKYELQPTKAKPVFDGDDDGGDGDNDPEAGGEDSDDEDDEENQNEEHKTGSVDSDERVTCTVSELKQLYNELIDAGFHLPVFSSEAITARAIQNYKSPRFILLRDEEAFRQKDKIVLRNTRERLWPLLQKVAALTLDKIFPFENAPDLLFVKRACLFVDPNNHFKLFWKKSDRRTLTGRIEEVEDQMGFEILFADGRQHKNKEKICRFERKLHHLRQLPLEKSVMIEHAEFARILKYQSSGKRKDFDELMASHFNLDEVTYLNFKESLKRMPKVLKLDDPKVLPEEVYDGRGKIDFFKLYKHVGMDQFKQFMDQNIQMDFDPDQLRQLDQLLNDEQVEFNRRKDLLLQRIHGLGNHSRAEEFTDYLREASGIPELLQVETELNKEQQKEKPESSLPSVVKRFYEVFERRRTVLKDLPGLGVNEDESENDNRSIMSAVGVMPARIEVNLEGQNRPAINLRQNPDRILRQENPLPGEPGSFHALLSERRRKEDAQKAANTHMQEAGAQQRAEELPLPLSGPASVRTSSQMVLESAPVSTGENQQGKQQIGETFGLPPTPFNLDFKRRSDGKEPMDAPKKPQ